MKLNSDDASIDKLAILQSTEDLSRTVATLETIKGIQLSNGEDINENLAVIREAIKRQTESVIYMFHGFDALGEAMGEQLRRDGDYSGFRVYERIGNILKDIGGFGGSNIHIDNIKGFVKRKKIKEVLTGPIEGEFLGAKGRIDDDYAGEGFTSTMDILNDDQVKILRELGVNVRILNKLV